MFLRNGTLELCLLEAGKSTKYYTRVGDGSWCSVRDSFTDLPKVQRLWLLLKAGSLHSNISSSWN